MDGQGVNCVGQIRRHLGVKAEGAKGPFIRGFEVLRTDTCRW